MAAVDAKHQIGPNEEWYLHVDFDVPLQPYRTAHTVWPLSTEELSHTERQAQSGNASALNNLGINERPVDGRLHLTHFACGVTGAMHLFGWGQRPVNRYKAYDCFCRAHSAGCAAATNNLAVCKWKGYGCKPNQEVALAEMEAVAAADSKASTACLMALVSVLSASSLNLY
jgi:TPR repeat protein